MKLLTAELTKKLKKAGYNNTKPICKLFTPWGNCTWLLTSMDSNGIISGWACLGQGCVEHGGIATLEDLRRLRGLVPIGVEGAIVGTALYVGNFTLPAALDVCRAPIPAD